MKGARHLARMVERAWRVARGRMLLARGSEPVSRVFATDRGKPIHRRYIDEFMHAHSQAVRGRVLEFQDPGYTRRFGGDRPTKIDVIDLDPDNQWATMVVDLTEPNDISAGTFDCIVCVHVLHVVFEDVKFVAELYRLLAPGGALLVAVPTTSPIDPDWDELRRYTPSGLRQLLETAFPAAQVEVVGFGNSFTAAAEMRGLAVDELTPAEIRRVDPQFPVAACAVAVKPES